MPLAKQWQTVQKYDFTRVSQIPNVLGDARRKWPTYALCILVILAIWLIGNLYAWLAPGGEWQVYDLANRLVTMNFVLGMITIFSSVPAVMYAGFTLHERERGKKNTLAELQHNNLQRLENEVGDRFDSAFSTVTYRVPVPLATMAMLVGWIVFFFAGLDEVVRAWEVSGDGQFNWLFFGTVTLENGHPVVFGFLGAYFFSLQLLLRRYFSADLRASVFMQVALRIITVMLLTLVLSVVWEGALWQGGAEKAALLAISFVAGMFPNVALNLIVRAGKAAVGALPGVHHANSSLDEIQGMNVWQQARLAEECIDNVQNLAMSDIVGLLVNTRLGLLRILHWVDQALLHIHVGKDVYKYQEAGIHTATEFETVYKGLLQPAVAEPERQSQLEAMRLAEEMGYVPPVPAELLDALRDREGLGKRVRSQLIALCDNENYRKLKDLRHSIHPRPCYTELRNSQ